MKGTTAVCEVTVKLSINYMDGEHAPDDFVEDLWERLCEGTRLGHSGRVIRFKSEVTREK